MNRKHSRSEPAANPDDVASVALDCYFSSLFSIAACMEEACPPAGAHHRDQLMRIRRRLAFEVTSGNLRDAHEALERELASFAKKTKRYCELKLRDVEAVLDLLSEALAADEEGHLRDRIQAIYDRVKATEEIATIDSLTGLPNRRELENQLDARIAYGRHFCALLFDIDDFTRFNQSLGPDAGDQVLKQLAEGLKEQVRSRDFLCRWKDDEFLILLECSLGNATMRANQIVQWIRGPYTLSDEGRGYKIEVTAKCAIVEHERGETADHVLGRVLAQLEEQKRQEAAV